MAGRTVDFEGCEQAGTDRGHARACPQKGCVVAETRDGEAGTNSRYEHAQEHGQQVDGTADGRDSLDGLKPEWEIVDHQGHVGADAAADQEARKNTALDKDAWWDGRLVG